MPNGFATRKWPNPSVCMRFITRGLCSYRENVQTVFFLSSACLHKVAEKAAPPHVLPREPHGLHVAVFFGAGGREEEEEEE